MIDELKWQHLKQALVDKSAAGPKIHILKPPNSLDCCKLAARPRKYECEPAYLLTCLPASRLTCCLHQSILTKGIATNSGNPSAPDMLRLESYAEILHARKLAAKPFLRCENDRNCSMMSCSEGPPDSLSALLCLATLIAQLRLNDPNDSNSRR